MKKIAKMQSVIVGIFDNAQDLDRAVERLAAAGFEDTVFDEAIVAGEPGNVGPLPVDPVLVAGAIPANVLSSVEPDFAAIVRAFKSHLADYRLPDQVVEAYATTFYRKGKFVLVKTDPERAEQVMEILGDCHASRVNRHD